MRIKALVLALVALGVGQAMAADDEFDLFTSREFGFAVMMPPEVVSTKGRHEHGTIGTFKAADTQLPVIYTVTVNRITKFIEQADNPEFKWGDVAIQGNFEGWVKELKALPKTIKKTPFKWNNNPAIRYTFTTDGTLKPGLPCYWSGMNIFYKGSIFCVHSMSLESTAQAEAASKQLQAKFIILDAFMEKR